MPGRRGSMLAMTAWPVPVGTEAVEWGEDVGGVVSNTLVPCPDCGHSVSQLAESCPSCARPLRKPAVREGLFLRTMNLGVALIVGVILFILVVPLLVAVAAYVMSRFVR